MAQNLIVRQSLIQNPALAPQGLTARLVKHGLGATTGFRASALASLTPAHFELDGNPPVVTLAARKAKNRKTKVQPIPDDIVPVLKAYLADKPTDEPIWPGVWARDGKGSEMLRRDLEEAGIAYTVDGPEGLLFADFHSLRHSYLTMLGRAGVDLRTAQELAGHASPLQTAKYSHVRLVDLAAAARKLVVKLVVPSVPPLQLDASVCTLSYPADKGADERNPQQNNTVATEPCSFSGVG